MSYALNESFTSREYSNWRGVFESLSLDEFNAIGRYVRFPLAVSEDIRQVGRDFIIADLQTYGQPSPFKKVPEPPVEAQVDFLQGVPEAVPFKHKASAIFTSAFSRLEQLGCAREIYDWASSTRDTHPHKHIGALLYWCRLLRDWLIVELSKDADGSAIFDTAAVQRFMGQKYVSKLYPPEHELELPAPTRISLLAIILNHQNSYVEFEVLVKRLRTFPGTPWTRFILEYLPTDSWISLEGSYRLALDAWRKIAALLSASEMILLEQWIRQFASKDRYGDLIVPMPVF